MNEREDSNSITSKHRSRSGTNTTRLHTHTDGVELDKMRKGTGTAFCLTVAGNFLSGEGRGTKGRRPLNFYEYEYRQCCGSVTFWYGMDPDTGICPSD